MRLAISNIAWDIEEDDAVASLLSRFELDAIDIAPAKYFPDLAAARAADFSDVRARWSDRGVQIVGMQALLFGTQGLNVFGDDASRASLLSHLGHVFRAGQGVGATRLVFGSPRNRDRTGLSDERAVAWAVDFFQQVAKLAHEHGVVLCLEPNPPRYGANFMLRSDDTAAVVGAVDHPAIRMQLDTGAITINGEDPEAVLHQHASLIGHVHASEPDLVPLGDGSAAHATFGRLLHQWLPEHVVSIEMTAAKREPHLIAIERSLRTAQRCYGGREQVV